MAGQFLVPLTGALALIGILGGTSAQGDLVGPYQDHQLYGSVLLLLLPFCAAALSAKSAPWRWGALAALTAGLRLFLSETRGAWIGLVAAGLVFGGLRLKQLCVHQKFSFLALVHRGSCLSPRLFFLPFARPSFIWLLSSPPDQKTALTARAATSPLEQDASWQSRLQLWRGTARMIEAHPLPGSASDATPARSGTGPMPAAFFCPPSVRR